MKWTDWTKQDMPPERQIRFIIECIGENDGWYNMLKFLPWWDDLLMLNAVGGRGCGKTDYGLLVALMLYIQFGCQTTWIRHKLNELSDEGNYNDFLNDAKALGWCPDEYTCKPDGVYASDQKGADKVILFASVSTFSNKRGSGHPRVMLCVFDEMIPEDGKYKPNAAMCVRGLMSLMESMTRGRPGSMLFVFSNYVNAGNPYWCKLEVCNDPKYEITVYKDKALAIQIPRGYKRARKEDSKLSKLMKAAKMPLYEDEKEDKMLTLIAKIPNGARPMPFVVLTDDQYYREFVHKGKSYWMLMKGEVPNGVPVMTNNVKECVAGVYMLPKNFYKRLQEDVDLDLIRFVNANVMFKIMNVLYDHV